jgi:hypothetical protein
MNTEADTPALPVHPLGPLAGVAALAQEWRTRDSGLGTTWAGLWHPTQQSEILTAVAQHAQRMDTMTLTRLARLGALPGVRDYSLLWALLLTEPVPAPEQASCVDSTTEQTEASSGLGASTTEEDAEDEDESAAVVGIPVWNHGVLEQAKLAPVRHAVHLVRHLDDYHEPTLAALRRQCLRKLVAAQGEERLQACEEAAETFLEQPTRWRDVVETAVHLSAVRACELHLGQRIKEPGRTKEQLLVKLETGLAALAMGGAVAADQRYTQFRTRLERLESAKVVLMYEEQQYLQLMGIRDRRSVRRHLPRGLHLIFSDQHHRREDRTAGLWLERSDEAHRAGSYHFADEIPLAYAARKQRGYFRLADADAVRQYVTGEPDGNVV